MNTAAKTQDVLVFASGSKTGGGSGFENLVRAARSTPRVLDANIVAVVSNYENGGVRERADRLGIPFVHFAAPREAADYQRIVRAHGNPWVILSGWLKLAKGLAPRHTINIHPGPLPQFGGEGMYGHHVHEAVHRAFLENKITESAVSMHFVTEQYDEGPQFAHIPVPLYAGDTPDDIASRVNSFEHAWQPYITNLVIHGAIQWDGRSVLSYPPQQLYPFRPL